MKKFLVSFLVFALAAGMYSCTKDKATMPAAAPVCDSTHISYNKTIVPIMMDYCTSCHNASYGQGANDLTTYTAMKAGMEDNGTNGIICRTTPGCTQNIMPQGSRLGLQKEYRDTLNLWKTGGYCN